jgi:tRNA threonylcarbamoyladenosine biosynthesis protein TsaE
MELITKSPEETKELGKKFATSLIEGKRKTLTVGLVGELGSGKTTFTQGFAQGLGIKKRVISPTYILIREYQLKGRFKAFYHVDLYRLEERVSEEAKEMGIFDLWEKEGNIVLIEWAEKISDIIPENAYEINFEVVDEQERKITIHKKL